jgi:hypothetical protein
VPITKLEEDVLPASPLVSSSVERVQLSRHVVPESRVAIATPPVIGRLEKTGSALAIALQFQVLANVEDV